MDESRISPEWLGYFLAGVVQVQNYLYGKNTSMAAVKREKNKN
jgi:hypothetical protein